MLHGTSSDGPGRQMNRSASWPIDKDTPATDLGDKRIEMLHDQRGCTPGVQAGRQTNRNATWPAGHQQRQTWETNE